MWSIASGAVGGASPNSSRSRSKTRGFFPGRRLRSPPKSERRPAGPLRAPPAPPSPRPRPPASASRWSRAGWRRRRRRRCGRSPSPAARARPRGSRSRAARRSRRACPGRGRGSGWSPPRRRPSGPGSGAPAARAGRPAVARGQRPVPLGAAGAGQRLGEARRALLQQRHVPLRPESSVANSAVRSRLTWTWVAFRSSVRSSRERQVRSPGSGGKSRPWKRFQVRCRELLAACRGLSHFVRNARRDAS